MADPVGQISNENSVSREEALFYLEGFNWDLNSAMEACRTKTLPPLPDTSDEFFINVKASLDSPPPPPSPSPPTRTDTVRNPNLTINPQRTPEPVQVSSDVRNEGILKFLEFAPGTTSDEALFYLRQYEWNALQAVEHYFHDRESGRLRRYQPQQRGINIGDASASSSSGSKAFDPTEVVNEADEALMISSQANVMGTNQQPLVPMVIAPRAREQQSQSTDAHIASFLAVAGENANREIAIQYLNLHGWDLHAAINKFIESPDIGLSPASQLQDSIGYTEQGAGGGNSSSVNADATNTGGPFDETGLVDVPIITDSGPAPFDCYAVDEDPSIETGPDLLATQERSTITFQVLLADSRDGAEEFMTFRSDQTLRDIRNKIAELRPDDNRDYYLTSVDGGDTYDDLDTTVQRIYCRGGGATKLLQVLSD